MKCRVHQHLRRSARCAVRNPRLADISGLDRAYIGGSIDLTGNEELTQILILCNMTIAGAVHIERVIGGDVITSLDVSWDLTCAPATAFVDLSALQAAVNLYISNAGLAETQYGPIGSWDTSLVTSMYRLFFGKSSFNADISGWNVARVTNMQVCGPALGYRTFAVVSLDGRVADPVHCALFLSCYPALRCAHLRSVNVPRRRFIQPTAL